MQRILHTVFLFLSIFLFCGVSSVHAQTYGNEWINYSQTYYKIKVGSNGIKAVSVADLTAAGMPAGLNASQIKLIRNGVEVPINITSSGVLTSTDFIRFYGQKNDGALDSTLYGSALKHTNPHKSLFADTSVYFLTYDNAGGHLRYSVSNNTIPANPGAALQSANTLLDTNFINAFYYGTMAYQDGANFYNSSNFTKGEGFAHNYVAPISTPYSFAIATPGLVTTGGTVAIEAEVLSRSLSNTHFGRLKVNGVAVDSGSYGVNDYLRFNASLPATTFSATTTLTFEHVLQGSSNIDQSGCAYYRISYPRDFNMAGANKYQFSLPSSASSRYLEFTNFNNGATPPFLYDATNKKVYVGDIATAGVVKFYIDASTVASDYVLTAVSAIENINNISARNFTNYSNAANSGNYILITHHSLLGLQNGRDIINEYKQYRNSPAGGGFTVAQAEATELYDQFAYGVEYHPISIKNFLRFAKTTWTTNPQYAYLIGKGLLYSELPSYRASANQNLPVVPTYGDPGSDNLFTQFTSNYYMQLMIGRLSVRNTAEIASYFDKMVLYENAMSDSTGTKEAQLWKKTMVGISGGIDVSLQNFILLPALRTVAAIVDTSKMGAMMTVAGKNNIEKVTDITSKTIDSIIEAGTSVINYFGHGGTGGFEYALKPANNFTINPKLPVFIAMACDVGRIFETQGAQTYTETYMFTPNGGTSAFLSSSTLTYTSFHTRFMNTFFQSLTGTNYGQRLGKHIKSGMDTFMTMFPPTHPLFEFYLAHTSSHILQGDPALRMMSTPRPDFYIDSNTIIIEPSRVTIAQDSIKVKYVSYNLGTSNNTDSVRTKIHLLRADGSNILIKDYYISALKSTDTNEVKVAVDKLLARGYNTIKISLDADSVFNEMHEDNNVGTKQFFVHDNMLVPIHPREYAIVFNQGVTLKASTLDPMKKVASYKMEIDTTQQFNSPLKLQTMVSSLGGVIEWQPSITMQDSVVYYWRAARDSSIDGNVQWTNSSFIYLQNGSEGWNQSHYFQYQNDSFKQLTIDADRIFRYSKTFGNIRLMNAITNLTAPNPAYTASNNRTVINGIDRQRARCLNNGWNDLMFMVVDTASLLPLPNAPAGSYGAVGQCSGGTRNNFSFEFPITTKAERDVVRTFLANQVTDGKLVIVRSSDWLPFNAFSSAPSWAADTAINGSGQSLYHDLKNLGFSQIDSYYYRRNFVFMTVKNTPSFTPLQLFSKNQADSIDYTYGTEYLETNGSLNSTIVGPYNTWQQLKWTNYPAQPGDSANTAFVNVYGLRTGLSDTLLATNYNGDTSLAWISPTTFPKLKLSWVTTDSVNRSAPQLKYWRILASPVPEFAVAPNLYMVTVDTVTSGNQVNMSVAVKNISNVTSDSVLVNFMLVNPANTYAQLVSKRYKILPGQDTLHTDITFASPTSPGNYNLYIDVNPFNDQEEVTHINNIAYIPFYTRNVQTPLGPITAFTITSDGSCGANVQWVVTGNDNEVKSYQLQRGRDAKNFQTIYTALKGASSYTYNDATLEKGNYQYRVKELKLNGEVNYTETKLFNNTCGQAAYFSVFPNPVKSDLQLHMDVNTSNVEVYIINAVGQKIIEKSFTGKAGQRLDYTFSLKQLASGNYLMYVVDGSSVRSVKIAKD